MCLYIINYPGKSLEWERNLARADSRKIRSEGTLVTRQEERQSQTVKNTW